MYCVCSETVLRLCSGSVALFLKMWVIKDLDWVVKVLPGKE